MHSYSVNMKRIKRRGSDLWLTIDKRGRIGTRVSYSNLKRKHHQFKRL